MPSWAQEIFKSDNEIKDKVDAKHDMAQAAWNGVHKAKQSPTQTKSAAIVVESDNE